MAKYSIIAKTSNELSEGEWRELINSFNTVFNKQFNVTYFKKKYLNTVLQFSIHGFLLHENHIVGMFSVIPRAYHFDGTEQMIGLGCDAFILEKHRKDDFFLQDMADAAYKVCKENNIHYLISIPNTTAYPYWKSYGDWKDIAALDYYILPYRLSKLVKVSNLFDFFSAGFFKALLSCANILSFEVKVSPKKKISLVRDANFLKERYNDEDGYKIYKMGEKGYFVIREYDEEGICTIYLVDCFPLSKYMLTKAIYQIARDFEDKLDVILFVGKMDSSPFYFIKVPKSKEPRVQPFIGYLLTEERKDDFLSISSWDVGLANFDNR
ncbi:MAG: GNAT family N-acetyltransferase [Candidatus Symbiothrix sp.]|jgi:hypothetical protein|nr:GNAT family N-acetyltransferase [Candidatus Symbiothrix sp.]